MLSLLGATHNSDTASSFFLPLSSIYHIPPFDQCHGHMWLEPVCLDVCLRVCDWDYSCYHTVCLCGKFVCVHTRLWCFDLPCSVVFELKNCVWQRLVSKQRGPLADKAELPEATLSSVKLKLYSGRSLTGQTIIFLSEIILHPNLTGLFFKLMFTQLRW